MTPARGPAPRRALAALAVCLVAGCAPTPDPTPAPATASPTAAVPGSSTRPAVTAPSAAPATDATLRRDFTALQRRVPAQVWVAVAGAGEPLLLGTERAVPAWSTSKVPLAVAAREHAGGRPSAALDSDIRLAITVSDNAAAERLWARLGTQTQASARVEAVLRRHGDAVTQVPTTRQRAAYTTFGQTHWNTTNQVVVLRDLSCSAEGGEVVGLMRQVGGDQRVGFGADPKAAIKGGWGPDPQGRYLARQIAVVTRGSASYAVAVVAVPRDGRFDTGLAALDQVAAWLTPRLGDVGPGYRCPLRSPGQ